MSEHPPPGVAEGPPVRAAQPLSPEAEAALADFRAWLADAGARGGPGPDGPAPDPVDLHTLVGHFVALRHEVNLQTRATRAQQEQGGEALRALQAALEALEREREQARRDEDERLRPLLQTLVDLHDSLELAGREIGRAHADLAGAADEPAPRAWWARWFGGDDALRSALAEARTGRERVGQALGALVAGYTMSLQRVERALRQHGLEPIAAEGGPFDPERMEVLEAVADSGRPAGEVLEEVRRGYLRGGRVFRYAQVRVAKNG